jgi:quercetin dioxygenase-like cupin family protein
LEPIHSLEDLLEARIPSAAERLDSALASGGIADRDIAATKTALAALGRSGAAPAPPPASLRDRVLASWQRKGKYGIFADRISRLFDLPLADAEALMERVEEPEAWMPFLMEGLEVIAVQAGPRCEGAIATLVRIQPGKRFPDHAHRGDETMFVLDGGFREPHEGGEEVWRGDEIFRKDGTEHALVGLPGTPCVAAVLIFGHGDLK